MINGLRNLKSISAALLGRAELYSKLIAVEAQIETTLLIRRLVWAGIGIVFFVFALATIHTLILSHFWHSEYRTVAITITLLVDGLIASLGFYMASKPNQEEAFMVTKHQLAEDIKLAKESI